MPARPSAGVVGKYVELRPELVAAFEALAEANHRSFRDELQHAMERHLESPPVRRLVERVPPVGEATVDVDPEAAAPRRRGRPPKRAQ